MTAIDVYGGYGLEALLTLHGEPVACSVTDEIYRYLLTIGDNTMRAYDYRERVGSASGAMWDSARISLADCARVVNAVRAYGWQCTEAEVSLFARWDSGQELTAEDFEGVTVKA